MIDIIIKLANEVKLLTSTISHLEMEGQRKDTIIRNGTDANKDQYDKIAALESKLTASQAEVERLKNESIIHERTIKDLHDICDGKFSEGLFVKNSIHNKIKTLVSTIKSREAEIKSLNEDVDIFQDAHADAYDSAQRWKNKHRRLVELIKRKGKHNGQIRDLLSTHRKNEAALKKRGGK